MASFGSLTDDLEHALNVLVSDTSGLKSASDFRWMLGLCFSDLYIAKQGLENFHAAREKHAAVYAAYKETVGSRQNIAQPNCIGNDQKDQLYRLSVDITINRHAYIAFLHTASESFKRAQNMLNLCDCATLKPETLLCVCNFNLEAQKALDDFPTLTRIRDSLSHAPERAAGIAVKPRGSKRTNKYNSGRFLLETPNLSGSSEEIYLTRTANDELESISLNQDQFELFLAGFFMASLCLPWKYRPV